MAEQFLHEGTKRARGPEQPLCEVLELMSGLHWRLQEVQHLPKKAEHREQSVPKREEYVEVSKTGRTELSKPFDTRHATTGCGVCSAGFWSYFGKCFLTTLFWNGNV